MSISKGTRYRTYKRATDKLASWLATTAETEISPLKQQGPAGSTHGLTIAQFSELTDAITAASPRIEVPLDILVTAEKAYSLRQESNIVLRGSDTKSDESHQHVISVIGEVLRKLSVHSKASKPEVNIDHSKETSKLEASFSVLDVEAMEKSDDDCPQDTGETKEGKNTIKNRKKKMLKKRKAAEQSKQSYHLEDDEDPYFVLMCLLSDLKSMRDYVKEIWQEYKEGKADLITVSVTTNATFDIIRTYETDFPAVSSLLSDYSQAVKMILFRNLDESDEGLALFFQTCTEPSDFKIDGIATIEASLSSIPQVSDLLFAHAFYFLHGPRHILVLAGESGRMPEWPESKLGRWREDLRHIDEELNISGRRPPASNGADPHSVQGLREDLHLLGKFANKVVSYESPKESIFISDHFTLQWKNEYLITGDKKITLAQAFGAQIYLDIHHTLGQDSERGLLDLLEGVLNVFESIIAWKSKTPQAWLDRDPEFIQADYNQMAIVGAIYNSFLSNLKEAWNYDDDVDCMIIKNIALMKEPLKEKFPFLTLHPLLCGVILFQAIHSLRDEGTYLAHITDVVHCAAQIYYSCQLQRNFWRNATDLDNKGLLFKRRINQRWKDPLEWKDMDYLIEMLGLDTFFPGVIPRSANDFIDFFGPVVENEKMMPQYWSQRKQREKEGHFGPIITAPTLEENESDFQYRFCKLIYNFQPIVVTHRLYYSKYFKGHKKIDETGVYDWTLETLQIVLENYLRAKNGRSEFGSKNKGKGKKKEAALLLKDDKEGNVSQVTILRTLKEVLQSESRALHFDFHSFHITCFQLLRKVRNGILAVKSEYKNSLDDNQIACETTALLATINSPTFDKYQNLNGYTTRGNTFRTNQSHIDMDAFVGKYLNDTDSKDREIKKFDSIWGIKPS